jgi:hypothetical protein
MATETCDSAEYPFDSEVLALVEAPNSGLTRPKARNPFTILITFIIYSILQIHPPIGVDETMV